MFERCSLQLADALG